MTTKPLNISMPVVRIGQIKTFGVHGPKYEVVGDIIAPTTGESLVPIRVIESGEQLEYKYSRFALDPFAF